MTEWKDGPEEQKVVLTLTDNPDGGVDLNADFSREVQLDDAENLSGCELTALHMLMHAFPPEREGVEWTPTKREEGSVDANSTG